MTQPTTSTVWIGMDVHQDSISLAYMLNDEKQPTVMKLGGDLHAVRRQFRRLAKKGTPRACYEASGAGYVLQRRLTQDGFHCEVIAPSLIPKKPGDRRKTDRLDAIHLARMYRSGDLTPVAVPNEVQEEVRQLVRTRLSVQREVVRLKHRIVRVLATHGHRFTGTKSNWTKAHRAWLRQLRKQLEGPLGDVLQLHLDQLEYSESQRSALDQLIEKWAGREPFRETVEALRCFRGIETLTAMTLASEIGDIRRFSGARQLMGYSGLIPGERSSGAVERRGPITKNGNAYLRRVLVEAAWHYQHRNGAQLILRRKRQGQSPSVVATAVKAQHRLSRRYWHLLQTKHKNKAITAVARELCGFVWAAMNQVA